ncbi:MAG: DUF3343 domain-containing protein [Peptococcaceae bacterium]|nr:DUF3343 domain-containing protein [Peptococcaceae bacterium]
MSYILTFPNTHAAIIAEKKLLQSGYPVGVMPMPTTIQSGCGIALRVEDYYSSHELLKKNNILVEAVYEVSANNQGTVYRKLSL